MDRDEAEAIAHLAHVETGQEVWCEQVNGAVWAIVLCEGDREERFLSAISYRNWLDARAGRAADKRTSPTGIRESPFDTVKRAIGGLAGLIPRAFNGASLSSDKTPSDVHKYMTEELEQQQEQGYGYRRSHPVPPEREV